MDRSLGLGRRERTGLLVGGIAMAFALASTFVAFRTVGLSFAPSALGQAIIELLPGSISVPLIEALQFWAERLLLLGVVALFLVAGALAGLLAMDPRRSDRVVAAAGLGPWVVSIMAGELFAQSRIDLPGVTANAAVGTIVYFATLTFLAAPAAQRGAALSASTVPSPSRRRLLTTVASVAAFAALGALAFGSGLRSIGARIGDVPLVARRLRTRADVPPADPAFEGIAGLTTRITPNEEHYVVDAALVKPRVDVATWRLEVKGQVEEPFALTYDELLDLEAVEQVHTLECISNPVGGDLISTAVWTGVPLRALLARARPKEGAFDVVLRSVDDYSDSFPIAKAMEPRTLVAYLMNGRTLPLDHGYPARVLVPDIYGMKNVKWLRSIEVATFDYLGYWQERGWSDIAIVNTGSRIDVPRRTVRWSGGDVVVAGIAFAGSRGIAKVEVSFDGGKTWQSADLETQPAALAWRRWAIHWTPPGTGVHRLHVRATDGAGNTQTATRREPFPNGATGYDTVDVSVQR